MHIIYIYAAIFPPNFLRKGSLSARARGVFRGEGKGPEFSLPGKKEGKSGEIGKKVFF